MKDDQTSENTLLNLWPPSAPEATREIVGATQGVPKHIYDLKPMGLRIDIDPPIAGEVSEGDVIRLILNSNATENTKTIAPGEADEVQTLYLSKGLLKTDQVNTLSYTVTRASGNASRSPDLTLLYNAIRPGIQDRTPGDGAHSELKLFLPQDVIDDGIDAERAKQGVQVRCSYPYCRAYDEIWLNCNGEDVYHTVKATEAPPHGSAEPLTIFVTVQEDVLRRAGDNPKFVFSYTVTDQLGNGPDTDSPFSDSVFVDVHLNTEKMPAAYIAEISDDPEDDQKTIDLNKLGDNDLSILIHTPEPPWLKGDIIRLTYTAAKTNEPGVTHPATEDVVGTGFTYTIKVPNIKVIADSIVRVKYQLERKGGTIATSKTTTATVIGKRTIELEPPTLATPAENPIDPLKHPDGAIMRINYPNASAGDRARLVEVNAPTDSTPFPLVAFNSLKQVDIGLSLEFLAARHGTDIGFRWNLNRNGGQIGKSPIGEVIVNEIADEDDRLPTPTVDGTVGEELDVYKLLGTEHLRIAKWPAQVVGQKKWLRYDGTDKNGNATSLVIWQGQPHDLNEGLVEPAPVSWLRELKNGSQLTITFKLNFSGSIERPVSFPLGIVNIKNFSLVSGYENWESESLQDFKANVAVKFKSGLEFTVLFYPTPIPARPAGTGLVGVPPAINMGTRCMVFTRLTRGLFRWEGGAKNVSIAINHTSSSQHVIKYYDDVGEIHRAFLPLVLDKKTIVSYNAGPKVFITGFELESAQEPQAADWGFFIDEIKWFN
ncbi:hypothetical protein [Pseudomonas fluorescens]|uniref:hypothetical protein n=1 Tax=Pseudomonas fluorescens TaxID=294 RepID=UPI00068ABB4C|nr:hypothetical protein [Pseudomonas fluorescens]